MNDKIVNLTESNFDAEVIGSATPVLIDFWAEWCGPCKAIAPILDEIAEEYAGRLKICKVDVDTNQEIATKKYGIRAIPTLIFVKDGTAASENLVGAISKNKLIEFVDELL